MKRFIFGLVAIAAFAMIGLGTGRAAAASSCSALVHTRAGSYEGVVDRSDRTSCPFARNVARTTLRFVVAAGGVGDGPIATRAYSPVTRKWYSVRCLANGDLYRSVMRVDCRAGIGAHVVYRAWSY